MSNRTEGLFETLKAEILSGTYPIGTRFPSERDVSEKYGVSRITTRDALSRLCEMGLLRKIPQSGTYVNDYLSEASIDLLVRIMQSVDSIDREILFSLLELRRTNEVHAAREAARRMSSEDSERLHRLADTGMAHMDDFATLCNCDYEMHQMIIAHSGNRVLPLLFNSFKPVYRHYVEFFYTQPGTGRHVMPLYKKLAAACTSQDGEYAAHIMETILLYAENRVKDGLTYMEDPSQVNLLQFRQTKRPDAS